MPRLSRDMQLAIGLFILLVAVTAISLIQQARAQTIPPPLASSSEAPNGTKALRLWLKAIGYRVSDVVDDRFVIPAGTRVFLLLEPTTGVTAEEWESIDAWVNDGGMLIVAGSNVGPIFNIMNHFSARLSFGALPSHALQTPLFDSPPSTTAGRIRTSASLSLERDDFVTHVAAGDRPLVVSMKQGNGRVILSTVTFPFTNLGLQREGNPELVLNLVSVAGKKGLIWFDEWHHGVRAVTKEIIGPGDWLRRAPAGQALLYGVAVVFIALLLHGRTFGRPIPVKGERARRAPAEYITAVANLSRRAGHRSATLRDYHNRLKRGLGRRHRIDPTLPDDVFVERLVDFRPDMDKDALLDLLQRLSGTHLSESELVHAAAESVDWLDSIPH